MGPGLPPPPAARPSRAIAQGALRVESRARARARALSPSRGAGARGAPAAQRYRLVPWRSEETGATATAHVVEGKTLKNGRITQLIGYAQPSEAYLHQNEGGHVPDGFPIWKDGSARTITEGKEPEIGDLDPAFKQWRWEQYYQADLRRCIGKELHAHHCQEPDALTRTKWIDGKVGLKD